MPLAMDRLHAEQAFHDRQADLRTATFRVQPSALHVDVDSYLDHETWIRPTSMAARSSTLAAATVWPPSHSSNWALA
jgi:hypothetical protein